MWSSGQRCACLLFCLLLSWTTAGAADTPVTRRTAIVLAAFGTDAAPALARSAAPLAVVTGAEDGLVRLHDARAYFNAAPNGRFFGALPNEHHCPAGAACGQMLAAALTALGV